MIEFEAGCFRLAPEQVALLVEEENLCFMAAHAQSLRVDLSVFQKLADRVREGGGLSGADYGPDLVRHGSRLNGPAHRILLPGK